MVQHLHNTELTLHSAANPVVSFNTSFQLHTISNYKIPAETGTQMFVSTPTHDQVPINVTGIK